jgi:hypothetical protein
MSAVYNATSARGSVYPNDYNYVALPFSEVKSVVDSFQPGPWSAEANDCDDKARRLWHMFKEFNSLCACGIVRLSSPIAYDIVGIVMEEDINIASAREFSMLGNIDIEIMQDDLLDDEIAEYHGSAMSVRSPIGGSAASKIGSDISARNKSLGRTNQDSYEMTLIEPYTRQIFKRSQGGTFGVGSWSVDAIKAFAVWF